MTYEELSRALRIREEELKTLRVELEKYSKELEVYKKALELACVALEERTLPTAYFHRNNFLNKAREELSNEANVLLQPGEE